MPQDDELLTEEIDEGSEVEQEEVEEAQDDDGGDSSASEDANRNSRKPFLEVDERTRYMTREDAIKGIGEAGKRIAALSAWERELKEYGDLTPTDVRTYLDELIETRQSASQLQAELEKFKKEQRESETKVSQEATRVSGESKLTKEEKEAVDWLKQQLPSLGYISKEDALKLVGQLQAKVDRIDSIEQRLQAEDVRYRTSLIEDSRSKLKNQLAEDGYSDDEEGSLQLLIENSIRAWVDSDQTGRRNQRFYAGGATKDALITEGYEKAKKALGLIRTAGSSTYTKSKAEALKRNAKTKLPAQSGVPNKLKPAGNGSGNTGTKKFTKRVDASGKRDYIGERHNQAWEVAQRYFTNNEEQ